MKKLLFLIIISLFSFEKSFSENSDIYKKIDLFGEVLEKISNEYVDEIEQSEVMDSAINGVLQSLDPYSSYMNPGYLFSGFPFTCSRFMAWTLSKLLFMAGSPIWELW